MARYGLYWSICACLAIASGAYAEGTSDDAVFKDWLTVVARLRSEGVDTIAVNWHPIEAACLGLKDSKSPVAYHRCMYKSAKDQFLHQSDRRQCGMRATAQYPDRLLKNGPVEKLQEKDKNGEVHTFERSVPAISKADLASLRQAAVIECMQDLGWADADNSIAGKRCE